MCILNAINHCKINKVAPIPESMYQLEKHNLFEPDSLSVYMASGSLALQNNTRDNKIKTSEFCRNGKYKRNNTSCFHVRDNPSSHKITCSICKLRNN